MTKASKYPMLDKMKELKEKSQPLGEFLNWLINEKGYYLCVADEDSLRGRFIPINSNIEKILADYFKIDLEQAEKERQMILENLRKSEVK